MSEDCSFGGDSNSNNTASKLMDRAGTDAQTQTNLQQHEDEVRRVPHASPRRRRHVSRPQDAHREAPGSGLHAHLLGHPFALAVAIVQLLPLFGHVCCFHEHLRL